MGITANKKQGLKILNFNVEGLASELDDPSLIKLINKHDICLLNETWKKDDSKVGLLGFWDFSLVRNKTTKKGGLLEELQSFVRTKLEKKSKLSAIKKILFG